MSDKQAVDAEAELAAIRELVASAAQRDPLVRVRVLLDAERRLRALRHPMDLVVEAEIAAERKRTKVDLVVDSLRILKNMVLTSTLGAEAGQAAPDAESDDQRPPN